MRCAGGACAQYRGRAMSSTLSGMHVYLRWAALLAASWVSLPGCVLDPSPLHPTDASLVPPDAPVDARVVDAAVDAGDAMPIDAGVPDARTCTPGSFSEPAIVLELATFDTESAPSLTADGLEIFFHSTDSDGLGGRDIWFARRASPDEPFTDPVHPVEVNSDRDDRHPAISGDGLTLYFASTRPGGLGGADIWVATRLDRMSPFSAPVLVSGVNSGFNETAPMISADGATLYFSSNRSGGTGGSDIWMAKGAGAVFFTPEELTELNTERSEGSVAISADELEIFVQSDREGSQDFDIWVATRAAREGPFSTPVLVPELSSSEEDQPHWLSPDGSTIFLSSDRLGDFDLFEARRACE